LSSLKKVFFLIFFCDSQAQKIFFLDFFLLTLQHIGKIPYEPKSTFKALSATYARIGPDAIQAKYGDFKGMTKCQF
jgi:hypothetical protein